MKERRVQLLSGLLEQVNHVIIKIHRPPIQTQWRTRPKACYVYIEQRARKT